MRLDEEFRLRRASIYSNPANSNDVLQHLYGDLTDGETGAVPCICIKRWDGVSQVFLIADHPIHLPEDAEVVGDMLDVFVYVDGVFVEDGWTFEIVDFEGQGLVSIITFDSEIEGRVSVDCYGKENGKGELIENLAEICYDLMINVHHVTLEEWHGPKYIEAYQNCFNYGYLGGGVVYEDKDPVELVNAVMHPIGAASIGPDQKLRIYVESFDPDTAIPDEEFFDQEIENWMIESRVERLANLITLSYRKNWTKSRFSQKDIFYDGALSDGDAQSQQESKVRYKSITADWIRYDEAAVNVLATLIDIWARPRWTIKLRTLGFKAVTRAPGDIIAFTRRTFPAAGLQMMRLQEMKTSIGTGRIELTGFYLDRLIGSPIVSDVQTVFIDVDTFIKPGGSGGETHFVPTFDEKGRPFTPKAVILSSVMSTLFGTAELGAHHAIGFSDGTTHGSCAIAIPDDADIAPSTTTAYQRCAPKALTLLNAAGTLDSECTLAIVTNGFELTWTTNTPTNYLINYMAIGGPGITDAKVIQWANALGRTEVVSVGFLSDMMFTTGTGIAGVTSPANSNRAHLLFSAAPRNGVQFAYGTGQLEGQSYPISRAAMAVGYFDVLPGFEGNAGFFGANSFGTLPARAWTLGSLEKFTDLGFTASWPMHQTGFFGELRYSLCLKGGSWQTIVASTPHDGSTGVPNSDSKDQLIDGLDMVSPRGVFAVAHCGAAARDLVHGSIPHDVMMLGATNFARVWCEAHGAQVYRPASVTVPINEGGEPASQLSWPLRCSRFSKDDVFIRIPPSGVLQRAGEETLYPPFANQAGQNIMVYTSGEVALPNRGEHLVRGRRLRERRTLKLPWSSLSNPLSGVFWEIGDDFEQIGVNDVTSHRTPVAYLIVGE